MKVTYEPSGGRYGYGFDYYCAHCQAHLGNSDDDEQLSHPTHEEEGIFFTKKTMIDCPHVGQNFNLPTHELEVKPI